MYTDYSSSVGNGDKVDAFYDRDCRRSLLIELLKHEVFLNKVIKQCGIYLGYSQDFFFCQTISYNWDNLKMKAFWDIATPTLFGGKNLKSYWDNLSILLRFWEEEWKREINW
jgi:hypothetical protein